MINKPELRVCLYDIHFPQYDKKTFRAILSFLMKNKVHGLLLGGDGLDLGCVSHWNANLPGTKRKGELKFDLDGFDKEILQPTEALLPRGCKKVFLTGNHERMLDQDLSESMPELDGMLDFKQHLRLAERGFKVVPLGGEYRIGDLLCIHGEVGSGGGNAAKKAVEIYCQNVLLGHGHQLQASSKCSPSSNKKKICAWMSPIVGSVSPRYLRHRANAWVNGFTLIYVRDNSAGRAELLTGAESTRATLAFNSLGELV